VNYTLSATGNVRFPHDRHRIELMTLRYPVAMLGQLKMNRVVLYCHECREMAPWPPLVYAGT
jgi:hypothetical protein